MTDKITVEVSVTVHETPAQPQPETLKPYTQTDSKLTDKWLGDLRERLSLSEDEMSAEDDEDEETAHQPPMTLEEARGYLARAVLTKSPEFVYVPRGVNRYKEMAEGKHSCSYFCRTDLPEDDPRYGTPCLVGVALRFAGREFHKAQEGRAPQEPAMSVAWNLSHEAGTYFRAAQLEQDDSQSWGHAYNAAEKVAEEMIRNGTDKG